LFLLYTESVITNEVLPIDDLEAPHEVLSLGGERSYTIDQLLRTVPQIDVIREFLAIHYDDFLELKEVKRYSMDFHKRKRDFLFSPREFSSLYGNRAKEVFQLLESFGYAESVEKQIRLKTKIFVTPFNEFSLGKSRKFESVVYKGIDKLLKRRISLSKDEKGKYTEHEAYLLYGLNAYSVPMVSNSSKDYIFKIGNKLLYIDFYYIPSQELLELIQLRLTLIFQEQMENFFSIVSSIAIERDSWQKGVDRGKKFEEVLSGFFTEVWTLFDLESLSLQIHGRDNHYSFVKGTYNCLFSIEGKDDWTFLEEIDEHPPVGDLSREFLAKNIQLVYSQFTGEPIGMDIYMKSRSVNNIDPRISVLLHSFIKLLRESVSRVIDTVIPIMQMEEANKVLRRHLFLETLRIKSSGHGENISLIIIESLSVLKWVFNVQHIYLYTYSQDFLKMLKIYQSFDSSSSINYEIVFSPFKAEEKRKKNILEIKVLEQIGEDISFYLKMPAPLDPGGTFLNGTGIETAVKEVIEQYDLVWPAKGLNFLASWQLSSNPGIVTNEIIAQLRNEEEWLGAVPAPRLADRVVRSLSLFFDLTTSLNSNLESGVTSMRGSRDRLTGLYNRQAFSKRLNTLFDSNKSFGLMFMDMDTFKIYNDAVSHSFGDKLLIQLSNQLLDKKIELNNSSFAGRFGGDEFCFAIPVNDFEEFESLSCDLFRMITDNDLSTRFHLEDRAEKDDFDINFVSFLHRLLRPDVGGVLGAGSDYIEKKGYTPKERLINLYYYYQNEINGKDIKENFKIQEDRVVDFFVDTIIEKVKRNKIFNSIDGEIDLIIRQFILLQMEDQTTDQIRQEIIKKLGKNEVYRPIRIRISTGLAHSEEDRLRSVSSIFNAADGRAYMAKHNGRNGLFGLSSQRLI
jgi:diguanylate cyclase (GGDEF)-like protein